MLQTPSGVIRFTTVLCDTWFHLHQRLFQGRQFRTKLVQLPLTLRDTCGDSRYVLRQPVHFGQQVVLLAMVHCAVRTAIHTPVLEPRPSSHCRQHAFNVLNPCLLKPSTLDHCPPCCPSHYHPPIILPPLSGKKDENEHRAPSLLPSRRKEEVGGGQGDKNRLV